MEDMLKNMIVSFNLLSCGINLWGFFKYIKKQKELDRLIKLEEKILDNLQTTTININNRNKLN